MTTINENLTLKGHVRIDMLRASGLKEVYEFDNLVVTTGKAFVASRMVGNTPAVMSNMAVGTDNTAPAAAQTALLAEAARVTLDSSGAAANVATYTATFGPGVGTGALVEAGIFNAASAGTMLSRVTYPVVNKGSGDTMSVTWTVTVN